MNTRHVLLGLGCLVGVTLLVVWWVWGDGGEDVPVGALTGEPSTESIGQSAQGGRAIPTTPFVEHLDQEPQCAELRVTDVEHRPISGAALYHVDKATRCVASDREEGLWWTDEDGLIRLPGEDIPSDETLLVYARGFEHQRLTTLAPGTRTTVRMQRHPTHRVIFANERGLPVRGVRFRVSSLVASTLDGDCTTPPGLPGTIAPVFEFRSNKDGHIDITELPAGTYSAWLSHPDCIPAEHEPSFELTIDGSETRIAMAEAYGFVLRVLPSDGLNGIEAEYPGAAIRHTRGTAYLRRCYDGIERQLRRRWPDSDMCFAMLPLPAVVQAAVDVRVPVRLFRGSHQHNQVLTAKPISKITEPVVVDLSHLPAHVTKIRIEATLPSGRVFEGDHSWCIIIGESVDGRDVFATPERERSVTLPYGNYKIRPVSGLTRGLFERKRFEVKAPDAEVRVALNAIPVKCEVSAGVSGDDTLADWLLRVLDESGKPVCVRSVWQPVATLWMRAPCTYTLECTVAGLKRPALKTVSLDGSETARRVHFIIQP